MAAPTSTGQVSLSGGVSTLQALMSRLARRIGDRPYTDTHSNVYSANGVSLTVASDATTRYEDGNIIDWLPDGSVDAALITPAPTATTLTIRPNYLGTTSAGHSAGATIRLNPLLLSQEYSDLLTEAVNSLYPDVVHVKQAVYTTPSTPADVIFALPTDAEKVFEVYQRTLPTGSVEEKRPLKFSVSSWFDSTWVTTKKALNVYALDTSITDVTSFYVIYGAQHTLTDLTTRQQDIVLYEAAALALEMLEDRAKGQSDDVVLDASNRIQLFRANARRLRALERQRLGNYLPAQDTLVYRGRHLFS